MHCFERVELHDLLFVCRMCDPPVLFGPRHRAWLNAVDPVPCPTCRIFTGHRACPKCRRPLPLYFGQLPQRTVAITGCRSAGKTVYLWSLMHQLWNDPAPLMTAMFEDVPGFDIWKQLARTIVGHREVPEATRREEQVHGGIPPLILRLLRPGGKARSIDQAVFYDPAGELIASLRDLPYLRYLAFASRLLFLVDGRGGAGAEDRAEEAANGLGHVTKHLRQTLHLSDHQPLLHTLAVAITKSDEDIFPLGGVESWSIRWRTPWWRESGRRQSARIGRRLQNLLRERGFDNFVNIAANNYRHHCFFAVSSLDQVAQDGRLLRPAQPVGVQNPLLWLLGHWR
jgi:hypothetical protein